MLIYLDVEKICEKKTEQFLSFTSFLSSDSELEIYRWNNKKKLVEIFASFFLVAINNDEHKVIKGSLFIASGLLRYKV